MKNKNLNILVNPDNLLGRDLILNKSGNPLEWALSFRTGHFARIQLVNAAKDEEKRHNWFLHAPTSKGTYNDAIKRKPIDRRSTKPFIAQSPSGMIRAVYHILKQYATDNE